MIRTLTLYVSLGIASVAAQGPTTQDPPRSAPTDWRETFADDFDTLDLSRWTTPYPWGGRFIPGNGEEQIYVDPTYTGTTDAPLHLDPFSVKNGILAITANPTPPNLVTVLQGRRYTSGVLTTHASFSQLYGYFEIRARFPRGKGLWPAFWLLPTDLSWPPEIDVVEILGDRPTTLHTTVHFESVEKQTGFAVTVPDVSEAFHTYGVLWTPQFIAWYFDHMQIARAPTPATLQQKPMYLLINLAVGGNWPGSPTASTAFPARMLVDFVRAYAMPPR